MNKTETREAAKIIQYGQTLGNDFMARALSSLYRSARTTRSQDAILAIGMAYGLVSSPEWR